MIQEQEECSILRQVTYHMELEHRCFLLMLTVLIWTASSLLLEAVCSMSPIYRSPQSQDSWSRGLHGATKSTAALLSWIMAWPAVSFTHPVNAWISMGGRCSDLISICLMMLKYHLTYVVQDYYYWFQDLLASGILAMTFKFWAWMVSCSTIWAVDALVS